MTLQPWQWALVLLSGLLTGMAKTGVPGLGILAVPVMAAVPPDPIQGTGLLLPLLCCGDLLAVWYYRRSAQVATLWHLLPWVILGGVAGDVAMNHLPRPAMRLVIGAIVLVMVAVHLARRAGRGESLVPDWRRAAVFGVIAGFATMVANAAGPVMNLYLLSMGLAKDDFMGTGMWFFLVVNLAKVPRFVLEHPPLITAATLRVDLIALPAVLLGALSGRWIYARTPQRVFEGVVLALTTLSALVLVLPALRPGH